MESMEMLGICSEPPSCGARHDGGRANNPKIKTFLHTAKARTREALELAIQRALTTITAADAHGWFTYCGRVHPD
jgi:hypothetical protein